MSKYFYFQFVVILALTLLMALLVVGEGRAGTFDGDRFKRGMVYGLTDIDQNTTRFCDGSLFGLNDARGRVILPAKYSDIEYCGHGLFLATDVQKRNKYYFGDKRHFFNRDGVELNYTLPAGAFLLNIFSFGGHADVDSAEILSKFPADTVLLFGFCGDLEGRRMWTVTQGLCDLKGKILFKTDTGTILFFKPGSAFIVRNTNNSTILNLKDWTEVSTKLQRNAGTIPAARIHWPSNYQVEMSFPKDRVRTKQFTDNGSFDHDYWCDRRTYPIASIDMFNRFLHDYDLIGMPADQVDILLGEPTQNFICKKSKDSRAYEFPQVGCPRHFSGVKVYTENERVVGWSFVDGGQLNDHSDKSETAKVITNVVLRRPKVMMDKRLVNGRIGEQKTEWPEVQSKSLTPW